MTSHKVQSSAPREASYDIAIVGGGFSGTALAIRLVRCVQEPISIIVIDRQGSVGRGVAYGTEVESHRLNVPAGKMSVVHDDTQHFVRWANSKLSEPVRVSDFLSRRLYGEYLEDTLKSELARNPRARLEWITADVGSAAAAQKARLTLADGSHIDADVVVLATGNERPGDPEQVRGLGPRVYAPYAWSKHALDNIPTDGQVLILGAGLTAIDQVLALDESGFDGHIYLLSRRGLLPCAYQQSKPWTREWMNDRPQTARGLLQIIRCEIGYAADQGSGWREVVDSLRPNTPHIWQNLPVDERRRFLRHLRPYWEAARHRVPPETSDRLTKLVANNKVRLLSGQVLSATETESRVAVLYRPRGSREAMKVTVDKIVNCTGPSTVIRMQDSLIRQLLLQGVARLDPLGMGLETDRDGALVSATGDAQRCIFALGPLLKPMLWEATAVPEIRQQVDRLSARIAALLGFRLLKQAVCPRPDDSTMDRVRESYSRTLQS